MSQFELSQTLLGQTITAQVTQLDQGLHVLLTGGERSHVGAVALAQNGAVTGCLSFPSHKEQVVCERWAALLSQAIGDCVTVACGIHYDNATPKQIGRILAVCEALLEQLLNQIAGEGFNQ